MIWRPDCAVEPGVVEDAVVSGEATREDRRVVGECDGRQTGNRSVRIRRPHLDQPGDVGRFAPLRHRVQHVRVGAVEQEADHVRRPARGGVEHVVTHLTVLAGEVRAVAAGGDAEQLGDRGSDVDEAGAAGNDAVGSDAAAGDHERCPRLDDAEGAVLTPMPALVLPVVGGGVDHAKIGGGRVVEQLRHLIEPVRVGVLAPMGVRVRPLALEAGEAVGRLVAERIGAVDGDDLEPSAFGPAEPHPAVVRVRLVGALAGEEHHVDDGLEGGVEEHLERPLGLGLTLGRDRVGRGEGIGHAERLNRHRSPWSPSPAPARPDCPENDDKE